MPQKPLFQPPAKVDGPRRELPREAPNRPIGRDWFADALDVILSGAGVQDGLSPDASMASSLGVLLGLPLAGGVKAVRGATRALGSFADVAPQAARVPLGSFSGRAPIKAYHGSPHDFDAFSLDKIGTGEGAQAYGHGLYFADNEGVARSYRDSLAAKSAPKSQGGIDLQELYQYLPDEPTTMAQAQSDFGRLVEMGAIEPNQEKQFLDLWDQNIRAADKGRMYEVNIHADPEDFLDWDAPLTKQPEKVRQALLDALDATEETPTPHITGSPKVSELTGEDLYGELRMKVNPEYTGNEEWEASRKAATELLQQRGVQGIKYFDAGSRARQAAWGADSGTRNYVVFDDKLIEILRKYGIAPPLAVGMSEAKKMGLKPEQMQQGSVPQMPQGDAFSRTMQNLTGTPTLQQPGRVNQSVRDAILTLMDKK